MFVVETVLMLPEFKLKYVTEKAIKNKPNKMPQIEKIIFFWLFQKNFLHLLVDGFFFLKPKFIAT